MIGGLVIPGTNSPDRKFWKDGVYDTARGHEERAKNQNIQRPYDASRPSAGAAGSAANQVRPDLDFTVDPTGRTTLSNQSKMARGMAEFNARLQQQAEERKRAQELADRGEFFAKLTQTPGATPPQVQHAGAGGTEAARTAAFSRAKDRAGQIARASLTAIAEEMAGRGLSGSGIESLREAGALDSTAGALLEVDRDQAIADAQRAGEVNDLTYQGGIQQRGQDLANNQSYQALLRAIYGY